MPVVSRVLLGRTGDEVAEEDLEEAGEAEEEEGVKAGCSWRRASARKLSLNGRMKSLSELRNRETRSRE